MAQRSFINFQMLYLYEGKLHLHLCLPHLSASLQLLFLHSLILNFLMFASEDTVQTVLHRTKQLKYVKMYTYVSISLFVVMLTPHPPKYSVWPCGEPHLSANSSQNYHYVTRMLLWLTCLDCQPKPKVLQRRGCQIKAKITSYITYY